MKNTTSNLALMTTSASLDGLTNKKLIAATQDVYTAFKAIDTSMGMLAYSMRKVRDCFKSLDKGETLDGYANYPEFAEKRLGIGRSQAFNLAKAGDFLRPVMVGKDGVKEKTIFVDCWTQVRLGLTGLTKNVYDLTDEQCKSFSNTAILRLSEFINTAEKKHAISAEVAEKLVCDAVKDGTITPDMSVSAIIAAITPKPAIEQKPEPQKPEIEPDTEQKPEPQKPEIEPEIEPEFLEFRLGKKWAIEVLKPELERVAEECPAIKELLTKF